MEKGVLGVGEVVLLGGEGGRGGGRDGGRLLRRGREGLVGLVGLLAGRDVGRVDVLVPEGLQDLHQLVVALVDVCVGQSLLFFLRKG